MRRNLTGASGDDVVPLVFHARVTDARERMKTVTQAQSLWRVVNDSPRQTLEVFASSSFSSLVAGVDGLSVFARVIAT